LTFKFHNPGKIPEHMISQVTLSIRCGVKWLFVRTEKNGNFDLLSTERAAHESPLDAARRLAASVPDLEILDIKTVCPYTVENENILSGYLCFAAANEKMPLHKNFCLFDKLPDALSRGEVTKRLFVGTQGWLNMQTNADELWDVYDADRKLTGRLHRRGEFLEEGDYHLVVHVWLLNSQGKFLLTKRAPNKGFPNTWETSGGAAQAGDDSLRAALREVREETGLIALPENAKRIYTFRREDDFCDVWLIRQDFSLDDAILLEGETIDKMYADVSEILTMVQDKKMIPYSYLNDLLLKLNLLS